MSSPDQTKLLAWWSHRQALEGRLAGGSAAEILTETGWARSVGGVNPYFTLFARAVISREAADAAVAALEIYELPSARGCTYVLPGSDFALGLAVGRDFEGSERKLALKLGATEAEIDKLCDAVLKALAKSPLDTDELRQAAGGAIRNFGPEGTKKGLATTLPVALGHLQSIGEIRRVPLNGRLDQQRYRYTRWQPNPLAKFKLSREEAYTELARRYFHWIGPATPADFQAFSGLGVKAAKAALEPLGLVPVNDRFLLPEHRDTFERFKTPSKPHYVLVGAIDGISLLRRDAHDLLAAGTPEKFQNLKAGQDFSNNLILDRGRLVGLWEYDPAAESIAWVSFASADAALKEAVRRTEEFVRQQLGDARGFSLDSPKSRAPRIEALRKAAAGK
jgi:hypothetical protein